MSPSRGLPRGTSDRNGRPDEETTMPAQHQATPSREPNATRRTLLGAAGALALAPALARAKDKFP